MAKTLVLKFGGTSVGNAAAIRQTAVIIQNAKKAWEQVVVVVSALSGVTNLLLDGAHTAAAGDDKRYLVIAEQLTKNHQNAIFELLQKPKEREYVYNRMVAHISEFKNLCHAVNVIGESSPRVLDAISSLGERISMHIVAAYLREQHTLAEAVRATELIRTDSVFQSASPDMEITRQQTQARLLPLLQSETIPIITGFIGADSHGVITTLGRGGSDFSGAIIAAALDADALWIMTDVNGVMTGDPRVVKSARTLATITFREVSELAYYGAKVLHPKTIRPVIGTKTQLWVKNTFDPDGPSTLIVTEDSAASENIIRAVTAIQKQTMITIEGRGMIGVQGIAGRTFQAVAHANASVSLITQASSEQSICFTTNSSDAKPALAALHDEFARELARQDIDKISVLADVVIITVVSAKMRNTPGIAGSVFSALGNAGVNIIAIAQGSSECSISLVTSATDCNAAVQAIHALIVRE